MQRWLCLFIFSLITGCQQHPAGDLHAAQALPDLSRHGNVYLLRGWRGLYSTGVNDLAAELQTAGVRASVYRESQWQDLADVLITRYRDHADAEPLILIGFSYGADNVVALSRKLQKANVRVSLLVTIDPVTPDDVPENVGLCRNYYQTNGVMDVFPFFRGVPLKAEHANTVQLVNINIHTVPELEDPNIGHRTIAASKKIHRAILADVLQFCPPVSTTLPATTRSSGG